jgi:hypothetical protein
VLGNSRSQSDARVPGLSDVATELPKPAVPLGDGGDFRPGHHGDIGWPEAASGSLSADEELVASHPSLAIPTRVISIGPRLAGLDRSVRKERQFRMVVIPK